MSVWISGELKFVVRLSTVNTSLGIKKLEIRTRSNNWNFQICDIKDFLSQLSVVVFPVSAFSAFDDDCRSSSPSATKTLSLHIGHVPLSSTQGSMHFLWNTWWHGENGHVKMSIHTKYINRENSKWTVWYN